MRRSRSAVLPSQSGWFLSSVRCGATKENKPKRTPKVQLDSGPFKSNLDYRSRLQFNAPVSPYSLSSIICTIGPASGCVEILIKLIAAGMRVARLNFSHGSHEYHAKSIKTIRKAVEQYSQQSGYQKTVAIALDTKGPEIRTGLISGSGTAEIELKQGDTIKLSTNKELEKNCTKDVLYVDYPNITKILKPDNLVYIDDGLIALRVQQVSEQELTCMIENGGKLGSSKGVNLPGMPVDLPAISEKDKGDLEFGVQQGVDMVFASFIRDADALAQIRQVLGPEGQHIKIFSKIENQQGMANIDDIIKASDGIMVARGDLGIEILTEDVLLAQKSIVAKCNIVGKPVICATQMLESMVNKPRPTRAEASDVGNAIFDGADCVMLSGETAKGKYPVDCVTCMAKICAKVEAVLWYDQIQNEVKSLMQAAGGDQLAAISVSISQAATLSQAKGIIVVCPCALVAQMISHARPRCPIIMLVGCARQARQSTTFRAIYPFVTEEMVSGCLDFKKIVQKGVQLMVKSKMLTPDKEATVVIVDALQADNINFRILSIKHNKECNEEKEKASEMAKNCMELAKKDECAKPKDK